LVALRAFVSPLAREFPGIRTMKHEEAASADKRGSEVGDDERCIPVVDNNKSPLRPEIRAAFEPTCCGSGCADCPF
jgi:hypothetical protein